MKKLFSILSVVLCLAAFTSCENSEDQSYNIDNDIEIISNNIAFDAKAQSGDVDVIAPGAIQLEYTAEWMTAEVKDSKIVVNVEQNNSLEGRAAVLTIKSEGQSKNITVQQLGYVFSIDLGESGDIVSDDKALKKSFPFNASLEVTVRTSAEWLKASVEEGQLNVDADANTTGNPRKGYVYYTLGGEATDSISVLQCEKADMLGAFYLVGFDEGEQKALTVELTEGDDDTINVAIPALQWNLKVLWDDDIKGFQIPNAQNMGTYQNYLVGNIAWDAEEGYVTWLDKTLQEAKVDVTDDGIVYAEWTDNGTWGTYKANSMILYAFSAEPFSSTTKLGGLIYFEFPWFQKKQAAGGDEAGSTRAIKSLRAPRANSKMNIVSKLGAIKQDNFKF